MATATAKRITLSTIKAFVRQNAGKLYIKARGSFDGTTDCVQFDRDAQFQAVKADSRGCESNTLGIAGAWFVLGSRDRFQAYDDGQFAGFEVSNCCGYFTLAIAKGGA